MNRGNNEDCSTITDKEHLKLRREFGQGGLSLIPDFPGCADYKEFRHDGCPNYSKPTIDPGVCLNTKVPESRCVYDGFLSDLS